MKNQRCTDLKYLVALASSLLAAHPKLAADLADDDGEISSDAELKLKDMAISLLGWLKEGAEEMEFRRSEAELHTKPVMPAAQPAEQFVIRRERWQEMLVRLRTKRGRLESNTLES